MDHKCQHETKLVCAIADIAISPTDHNLIKARETVLDILECSETNRCACDRTLMDDAFKLYSNIKSIYN